MSRHVQGISNECFNQKQKWEWIFLGMFYGRMTRTEEEFSTLARNISTSVDCRLLRWTQTCRNTFHSLACEGKNFFTTDSRTFTPDTWSTKGKKKAQQRPQTGHGHVRWVRGHVPRISREKKKKKFGTQPQTPRPLSEKSRVHTHTPLTEYFPFGSPTKLQYI